MNALLNTVKVQVAIRVGASSFPLKAPPPGDVEKAKRLITDGIRKYWSRSATQRTARHLTVAGTPFNVETTATVTDYGVEYVVEKAWVVQRSCNWGVLEEGLPIAYVLTEFDDWNEYVGAHEFGHSVLLDGWGREYSFKHKGTTNAIQNVTGPAAPPPPAEVDVMKYYPDTGNIRGFYQRTVATEADVTALIATVRLKFSPAKRK